MDEQCSLVLHVVRVCFDLPHSLAPATGEDNPNVIRKFKRGFYFNSLIPLSILGVFEPLGCQFSFIVSTIVCPKKVVVAKNVWLGGVVVGTGIQTVKVRKVTLIRKSAIQSAYARIEPPSRDTNHHASGYPNQRQMKPVIGTSRIRHSHPLDHMTDGESMWSHIL